MGRSESQAMALIDYDFSNSCSPKDIYPIVSLINDCFLSGDYDSVNYVLENIDFQKQNTLSLICFIRTTVRAKQHLPSWRKTLDKISTKIENPDKLLRGLYD